MTDWVLTFTTAVRVIVRVHDSTTDSRTLAQPSGSTCFTLADKVEVLVADSTNGSTAGEENLSDLAGSES